MEDAKRMCRRTERRCVPKLCSPRALQGALLRGFNSGGSSEIWNLVAAQGACKVGVKLRGKQRRNGVRRKNGGDTVGALEKACRGRHRSALSCRVDPAAKPFFIGGRELKLLVFIEDNSLYQ